jgi:formylglycine-generating enzyme required for sulfatase activity
MHCDKCNTDFPEGLRYCKWCGGPLVNRPRITSELHACPSCAGAIQPSWTFCKACGERLHAASRESVVASCPKCGAPTDPGAQTCLRCGEDLDGHRATQNVQDFRDTALIAKCSACGERLDTGSLYCKACGSAAYIEETHPTIQQKAPTLPDLDEQMAARLARQDVENTWALTVTDSEDQVPLPQKKGSADTSMLPGTAGARSEQQSPTSIIDMGRITGPVEDRATEVQEPTSTSGELGPASPPGGGEQAPRTTGNEPAQPLKVKKPATSDFGSDPTDPSAGSENRTEVFVSPLESPPAGPTISQDGIGARQFDPAPSSKGIKGTREIPPPGPPANLDPFKTTEQRAFVPEWTSLATIESSGARDLTQPEVTAAPVEPIPSQPLPQKRTGMMIASVVVTLIVVGGAIYAGWWFLFARVRPAPPVVLVEPPPPPPVVSTPPEKPPAPVVPEGMVAVAAGSYTIGRDDADPLEKPQHKVDLPAFVLDRTEVTNAAYKKFMDATGHKAPTNWTSKGFPEGRDNSPVTGVTWQDAADYAAWAGKRLPTEAEWEAAARGADGRIYPWGNDYRSGIANIGSEPDDITADQYPSGIKDVGRYPQGASPVGALDMIGNAWEWAADVFDLYPGGITSIPKDIKDRMKPGLTYRVIRGGAYDGNKKNDATYRGLLDGSQAYPKVGFRCAKDAK